MKDKIERIIQGLEKELIQLELDDISLLEYAEEGIRQTKQALESLRKVVFSNSFVNKQEEITFFKHLKPKIFSRLIYYVKLFNIESKRPRSSSKSQIKYLNLQIDKLQVYFNDNLEFYNYYRRGALHLDKHYFIRGKSNIRLHPDSFHFFTDDQFSTSHDATVATILAYDMLIIHLKQEIDKLENYNNMEATIHPYQKQSKLFWTGSKTDLIELIYALQASGAINSGTADIKEMATACEQLFNVDLGNIYQTFIEIRARKINNTKFIDKLKESLENRLEESDE